MSAGVIGNGADGDGVCRFQPAEQVRGRLDFVTAQVGGYLTVEGINGNGQIRRGVIDEFWF
jgi:hypothetical protein